MTSAPNPQRGRPATLPGVIVPSSPSRMQRIFAPNPRPYQHRPPPKITGPETPSPGHGCLFCSLPAFPCLQLCQRVSLHHGGCLGRSGFLLSVVSDDLIPVRLIIDLDRPVTMPGATYTRYSMLLIHCCGKIRDRAHDVVVLDRLQPGISRNPA